MKEIKKKFARTLRKEQTKPEKTVWELIRNRKFLNLKFRRQHVIEGFVLDFYCHEQRMGIEIDGGIHKRSQDYDRIRQDIIESEGIKIIRIRNKEITENKKSILEKNKESNYFIDEPLSLCLPAGRRGRGGEE